jgi:uncharacterized protein YndB with AHSA1/START domain
MDNLKEKSSGAFTITREFEAPPALVFKAWTEAEQLAKWWGPKGMEQVISKLDLRPGGIFLYYLELPGDQKMWGRFVYSSIVAPERIVYISSFSDEEGGVTRAPFSQTWPLEIHNTLTFTEKDGKTMLTLRSEPLHATTEERRTFENGIESLQQGFSGTLDQLQHYLSTLHTKEESLTAKS